MSKMYGSFTSADLDDWEKLPNVAPLLTSPHFGAWLWRRDENRDKSREVKPVMHGKWEKGYSFPDGEYVKCTVCGEIIKCIYPMHYCPNCGADMRESEVKK